MRFRRFNLPLTPSLVRRGNAGKSPLLTKEGPGEVTSGGYITVIVNGSTKDKGGFTHEDAHTSHATPPRGAESCPGHARPAGIHRPGARRRRQGPAGAGLRLRGDRQDRGH